jgi:hypothetical protein
LTLPISVIAKAIFHGWIPHPRPLSPNMKCSALIPLALAAGLFSPERVKADAPPPPNPAVDAGAKAAAKVGELVSSHIIARPHEDLMKAFLGDNAKPAGK